MGSRKHFADNMVNFYTIDASTGAFSKKVYRVAGEHATWKLSKGTLTISGSGAITVDTETHFRHPVSSTQRGYVYSSGDNAWLPVRDQVKKLVIGKGITSIPESEFAYFSSLAEVEIKSGLKSIGKEAFRSCGVLTKITIPSSVTSIGDDFLWTGSYWIGDESHVVRATIYAPYNSYAIKYAKKQGIRYNIDIVGAKVSRLKASYTYNGKAQKPSVTVKLGSDKLKKDTDYTLSYKNNKKAGKASIEIKGIGNYSGTVTKTFVIKPSKVSGTKLSSPKTRTLKLTWKKNAQADGYIIQYAKNSKMTKGSKKITISKNKTVSKKLTKLIKKKKYYVCICAYKTVSGKKYCGTWSKVMSVQCK